MTTYNPNDFSPMSGKEINSQGNVVTPADGINVDGSQNVVVLGRKAQEIVLINALTITDTATHVSSDIDISSVAGQKNIVIYNALNQALSVNVIVKTVTGLLLISALSGISVSAGNTKILTDVDMPMLKGPIQIIRINLSCVTAPTSGNATVILNGVSA